jgi:hypothetical protein
LEREGESFGAVSPQDLVFRIDAPRARRWNGCALYAGGWFNAIGGVSARVASWDGNTWAPLGSGVSGSSASGPAA